MASANEAASVAWNPTCQLHHEERWCYGRRWIQVKPLKGD